MNLRQKGFTLIELLIVIGLLAAIAVIVLAAINPIEQANRARDTRYATEASEVVKAVERYYATRQEFPWVGDGTTSITTSNAQALVYESVDRAFLGICGTNCDTPGALINNQELRSDFLNKDFIEPQDTVDELWIGKEANDDSTVYVCYIPVSRSAKETAVANNNAWTLTAGNGVRTDVSGGANPANPADNWATETPAIYTCLP